MTRSGRDPVRRAFRPGSSSFHAHDPGAGLAQPGGDRRRLEGRIGDDQRARSRQRRKLQLLVFVRVHRLQGDRKGKDRTAARIIREREFAPHEFDQFSRYRKTETRAVKPPHGRAVSLLEVFEDCGSPLGGHARAGVDHGKMQRFASSFDRDAYTAGARELDGVARKVGENLPQSHSVGADEAGRFGANRDRNLQSLALSARRQQLDDAFNQSWEFDRIERQPEMPGFDPRKVEDLINQRDQRPARGLDRLDIACVFRALRALREQTRHTQDPIDRGADLVTHGREEAGLRAARRLGAIARGRRFLEPPDLVAQQLVVGGKRRRPRFSARAAPGNRTNEGDRESEDGAGVYRQPIRRQHHTRNHLAASNPRSTTTVSDARLDFLAASHRFVEKSASQAATAARSGAPR